MPPALTRRSLFALALLPIAGCSFLPGRQEKAPTASARFAGNTPEMQAMIRNYASFLEIPPELLDHVVRVESGYNPAARNGSYYGLMQVNPQTARTMGYQGPDAGLLDAETNLRWAGAYLRGAYIVANGNQERAYDWYRRGYYYEARDRGLLEATGLRRS
ncbi:MAG TPA: lytic transglycosylase domain-containing protein [Rubellimicrobium sp.]|nr:lytic transglycosylase domain-containing protein [Rubellimicrobium sp.]